MAGKTNTKQICVFKTQKMLLEFMDDTRYDKEPMAWPHTPMSRIRVQAKDYSEGVGELAVDAFYNLSPDEFYRLYLSIQRVKTTLSADYTRVKKQLDRLIALRDKQGVIVRADSSLQGIQDIADQFSSSSNELFSEAGEKMQQVLRSVAMQQSPSSTTALDQMIEELTAELTDIKTSKEVFSELKILNYDKYINPENDEERRVTMIKVVYNPKMNYPFVFTVANGWGIPLVTKSKGVIIQEGSTRFVDTVNICLDEKGLLPMLKRVDMFIQAMTTHSLARYYEAVTNPVLYYQMNSDET